VPFQAISDERDRAFVLQHYHAGQEAKRREGERSQQQATKVYLEVYLRGDRTGALPATDWNLLPSWQRKSAHHS